MRALEEGVARPDDLLKRDHARDRGVLDQCDHLIRDGRHDPLDHLQQCDLEKDLPLRHAEHLPGLLLSCRNALNPASVDFGKIAGVIQNKCDGRGEKAPVIAGRPRAAALEQRAGDVENDDQLEHQRRAAHDPDDQPYQQGNRPEVHKKPREAAGPALSDRGQCNAAKGRPGTHGTEGNEKPQRERTDQSDEKQL